MFTEAFIGERKMAFLLGKAILYQHLLYYWMNSEWKENNLEDQAAQQVFLSILDSIHETLVEN